MTNNIYALYNIIYMISHEEMVKRSHEAQFGHMTKEEKSEYFRQLQAKRKTKRGKYSKTDIDIGGL